MLLTHEANARRFLNAMDRDAMTPFADEVRRALAHGLPIPEISGAASAPSFSPTPKIGSGLVPATLDTSLTAPTNTTTIVTAAAAGTQVFEIVLQGVLTTVLSVVNIFRYDGTYHLYEQVLISAVTSSTTAVTFRTTRQYTNLVLVTGDTLRVTNTVAGNQSGIKVTAHGGDLT